MSTLRCNRIENTSTSSGGLDVDTSGKVRVTTLADSAGNNDSTPAEIASGRAKAWVNFNGIGTVAIRASYNVTSITDNGTGDYTVIFTTPMPNTNYCFQLSATDDGIGGVGMANGYAYGAWKRGPNSTVFTTTSVRFQLGYPANQTLYDQSHIMVTIFAE